MLTNVSTVWTATVSFTTVMVGKTFTGLLSRREEGKPVTRQNLKWHIDLKCVNVLGANPGVDLCHVILSPSFHHRL